MPRLSPTLAMILLASLSSAAIAQSAVKFDPDGTAHLVDLEVPIPATISPEAQQMLRSAQTAGDPTRGFTAPPAELRAMRSANQPRATEQMLRRYPSRVEKETIGGVPVTRVTPEKLAPGAEGHLLLNVHGGAFVVGQGSITEAIPIAARSGIPVLAIDYRLAPEHPFPAAVDDTVAVYRELLKTYAPGKLALFGSSSGAILTAQAAVRMRQLGLPLPAALGFFSGTVDFARRGDTEALYSMGGFAPMVPRLTDQTGAYIANHSLTDPVMSPAYADVKGFPPTLLMTGTRDFFLSAVANFHRQLLRASVPAELVVFDGMPHVHWGNPTLPESNEALDMQAKFLAKHVMGTH